MKTNSPAAERFHSLDLLRLVCMLMIVCGHGFGYGAAHVLPDGISATSLVSGALSTFFGVAVNCFILISGFFSCRQRFRPSRLLRLMGEVLFYSWAIAAFTVLRTGALPPLQDLLTMALPVSFGHFWFVSAYVGLSLLSPVLNWALNAMTQKQHAATLCVLLVGFSLWSDVIPRANPFGAGSGYCLTWFVVLYVVAAYLRRFMDAPRIRKGGALALYGGMMALVFTLNTAMALLSRRFPVLAQHEMDTFFSRYNCIFVLTASVALFCAFWAMKPMTPRVNRSVSAAARLTLGVYLIHGGAYTSSLIWQQVFALLGIDAAPLYPLLVMVGSVGLFFLLLGVDFLRSRLFLLWENRTWYARMMARLDEGVYRLGQRICEKTMAL